MKDYWFKIKVSDLLRNTWQKDSIVFENKFSSNIENLTKEWMKWEVYLQSLDENTVFVEIKDLEMTLDEACEICLKDFERKVEISEISTKFIFPDKMLNPEEKVHDEEFEINPKDETIDLEEFIVQLVISERPVVLRCAECEEIEGNDEENEDTNSSSWNSIKWL